MQTHPTISVERPASWLAQQNAQRIIFANQRMIFWLFYLVSAIWRRSIANELEERDLVHGSRYVVACNHQSGIDPFFICTQLPYRIWRHMGTLNYFAANMYINMPVVGAVIMRLGAFPAKVHHRHPYGLGYATQMLRRGNTVLIFPEGRRTRRGESPVRHGIEALAQEPNVMVVPAHIEWSVGRPWRTFKLGIGKPFDASTLSAQEIMDRVYAQPVE